MASHYKLIMVLKLKFLFSCLPFYNPFCLFLFSNFEMGIQPRLTSSFLCSPGSPRTFETHSLPPKCQAYRVPPHLNFSVLGWDPRASCMLDKFSTSWVMFPAFLYTWKLNLQLTVGLYSFICAYLAVVTLCGNLASPMFVWQKQV